MGTKTINEKYADNPITTAASNDILPLWDVSASEMGGITTENLLEDIDSRLTTAENKLIQTSFTPTITASDSTVSDLTAVIKDDGVKVSLIVSAVITANTATGNVTVTISGLPSLFTDCDYLSHPWVTYYYSTSVNVTSKDASYKVSTNELSVSCYITTSGTNVCFTIEAVK